MSEIDDVCVISHPIESATTSHAATLVNILDALTSVSVVALSISDTAEIRDHYEALEVSGEKTRDGIVAAALQFVLRQLRLVAIIRRRPEQLMLFFGTTSYVLPIVAAKLSGKTVVLLPRGNVPHTLRLQWEQQVPTPIARLLAGVVWSLERLGYRLADAIITYTPAMAATLNLQRFGEKLYPHGARYIDTDRFYPHVPYASRDRTVGFLGRLDEEKNVRLLADVAQQLPADVTFRFIGDGPLREELEQQLAAECAAGRVEFTGWVDHDRVPKELSTLRVLVLPSEPTEGLPTVLLEALACGTPAVATPVAGVPDVIEDGETGYLIDTPNTSQLTETILIALEDDGAEQMSNAGRKLVEEEYDFWAAQQRYKYILESL